jgi:drug/metabolite transporter (DMT)-like permease
MQQTEIFARILTIVGVALLTGLGDLCAKLYSLTPCPRWFLCAMVGYGLSGLCWLKLISQFQSLVQASIIWVIVTTVIMLCISQIVFNEPLTSQQGFGILLGILAFLFML